MRLAPWTDYAGQQIYEGDTIVHPAGERGIVKFLPEHDNAADQWRVDYGAGALSRLMLQIGDKGQAAILVAAPPTASSAKPPHSEP